MRIAHVITRLIVGGAQENTVLCCRDLIQQHGDDVLLISGPALGPEGSLFGAAAESEVPSVIVPQLRRSINPIRDWIAYRQIKKALREFSPDVVHTHSAKAGILGRYAAWSLGIPAVIHTVHGAPFHQFQNRMARAFFRCCERHAAARCHKLVSVADAMTELMVESGVAPREKFVTVYSGMDVDLFLHADQQRAKTRAELGYDDGHVVVGKVARLFHLKGHDDIIDAAREIVDRLPNVRFLFVGDGILQSHLQDRISKTGLDAHFKFTGLVSPAKVAGLISAMDMVVHTSLREGLARVLPQALIVGRPVISYDVDGAREVVLDGETGRLIAPRDIAGLAGAIIQLGGNNSLRKSLGAEGQRRFQDQFRHELMTRQLRDIYSEFWIVKLRPA
jgi:glycosyltransferase involved in cell wall biosynthesis